MRPICSVRPTGRLETERRPYPAWEGSSLSLTHCTFLDLASSLFSTDMKVATVQCPGRAADFLEFGSFRLLGICRRLMKLEKEAMLPCLSSCPPCFSGQGHFLGQAVFCQPPQPVGRQKSCKADFSKLGETGEECFRAGISICPQSRYPQQ